jgi:hypothetical protein
MSSGDDTPSSEVEWHGIVQASVGAGSPTTLPFDTDGDAKAGFQATEALQVGTKVTGRLAKMPRLENQWSDTRGQALERDA